MRIKPVPAASRPIFTLPPDLRAAIREKVHEFAGRSLEVVSRRKKFRRASWQR